MNSEPEAEFLRVTEHDESYPASLRELPDRPGVLYVKGRWPLPENRRIGIVGTRRASRYGLDAAREFTRTLVRQGIVTVSGLAAGIDACAHRMTLEEKGWTIAVLGHGLGYEYPRENKPLYQDIAREGTLLTEFPYDTSPQARYFPQRNRIISGLSEGILVIEAGDKSGALITARYAAEQGRDVFVVPGSIFSLQSVGCHRLIRAGAALVESGDELLLEYGPHRSVAETRTPTQRADSTPLTPMETRILERMSVVPISVDELAEASQTPVDRLAEILLALEIKGRVQAIPGQRYVTCYEEKK